MASVRAGHEYPILVVPTSDGGNRTDLSPYFSGLGGPGPIMQRRRLAPRFQALSDAMRNERLTIASDIAGTEPELVIVLEVRDSIAEFQSAVRRIPGLEFLAEFDEGEEEPDEGFTTRSNEPIELNYYVVAQNQRALQQLKSMWDRWCANRTVTFDTGLYPWKKVFEMLKDVRPWSAQDRLKGTTLVEAWSEQLASGVEHVNGEIELWYRESPTARAQQLRELEEVLRLAGCSILDVVEIPAIAYHALLARVPADIASQIISGDGAIINDPRVSAARPQSIGFTTATISDDIDKGIEAELPNDEAPLVAILDGVPLDGHEALRGRLQIDDPHDFGQRVEARHRNHGTGIASAVIWGDLEAERLPLARKVVLHPIFVLATDANQRIVESMSPDRLAVGVVHRALHRLLVGSADEPPIAPSVQIVVLAAGHTALPYGIKVSPWGRLLDMWASNSGVLFIVSAGNHGGPIELDGTVPLDALDDPELLRRTVGAHLLANAHQRRILSPADSMNALTVGALHNDAADFALTSSMVDVVGDPRLPSPTSALGGGFNRQLKPDVFANGGRVLYRQKFEADHIHLEEIIGTAASPGVLVAAPGQAGQTDAKHWMQGTSAATALIGHEAGSVAELLSRSEPELVSSEYYALATKALIVNASSWADAHEPIAEMLNLTDTMRQRRAAGRFLGYGAVHSAKVAACDAQRITLLASGQVLEDRAREVVLPVPATLSGRNDWRRVSATLVWFTPTNPRHKSYRQARLWLEPTNLDQLGLKRSEVAHEVVRRGSTHHELYEGERRIAYGDNSTLRVRVNCAAGAGSLSGPVRFAIALTFEVAPESDIPVYDEISLAIQTQTRVTAARAPIS